MGPRKIFKHIASNRVLHTVAESSIAILVLVALMVVCLRLHVDLATASLLCVIVIVLLARVAAFISSIVAAVVAALVLAYLAPPTDSFRIKDPLDVVAVVTFLITALIIGSLVYRVRKLGEEALSSVNRKLVDAEERERSRLGRELHDHVCQQIALASIKFDKLVADFPRLPAEVLVTMDQLRKEIGELSSDVQVVAHSLHSQLLEYLGLVKTARSFCREYGDKQRVEIDFRVHDLPSSLPTNVSLSLFRVMQEALHNSAKHSGTRQFEVELFEKSDTIHLLVRDSGQGFNPKEIANSAGLGFTSMRERIKLVNGELLIESRLRHGTTVHAKVPIDSTSNFKHLASQLPQ